ncbi:MAG: aspartyl protease family protein [Parvibaculaceae bacterium]
MNHSDMRPEWSGGTTERNFVLPAVVIVALMAVAAYAAYYFTQPKDTYAISSETFSRLTSSGQDLALRLNKEPCNQDIAGTLANALANGSEYAATISFVNYTEKKCGDNEDLWMPLYAAQMGSSDYVAAETTMVRVLKAYPYSSKGYYSRGKARSKSKNYAGAYDDYQKSIYVYDDPATFNEKPFMGMANAAAQLGRPCEAVSIMQDYVAFDNLDRRTPALRGLMRDWQTQGKCPAPFGNGKARLKYERLGGGIMLPVTINGVTGNMIIDTGASRTALTQSFAKRAGIKPSHDDGSMVHTANGTVWAMGGRAEKISLGAASSGNVPVFIQTEGDKGFGPGIDGLLGLSFLGNFKFTLNDGVLELTPLS